MVAEREQGPHPLGLVGAARKLDRALEVLARLLEVADAAKDAAEDPVGAARSRRLAEPLGQPQRLLGGVDREHVVSGVHVERRRLLVEAHQLDAGRAVLEQVDALLVVVDRGARGRPCARARRRSFGAGRRPGPGPPGGGGSRGTAPIPRPPRRRARGAAPRRPSSRPPAPRPPRPARPRGRRRSGSGPAPPGWSSSDSAASPAASRNSTALAFIERSSSPSTPASLPSVAARP